MPFPSPEDLPGSGIEPTSPALAGRFFTTEPLGKPIGDTEREGADVGIAHWLMSARSVNDSDGDNNIINAADTHHACQT